MTTPPSAPHPPGPAWTRRALVLASAAVVTGGWLLLAAAGVDLPPLSRHWPLFLVAGGVASLADYALVSRRPAALGLGLFALVLGIDLYFPVLDALPWRRIGLWGPGIYLAVGLGCLAAWAVASERRPRLLLVGGLGVGLAVTFWWHGALPLGLFWGALLLLLGATMVIAVLRHRARRQGP